MTTDNIRIGQAALAIADYFSLYGIKPEELHLLYSGTSPYVNKINLDGVCLLGDSWHYTADILPLTFAFEKEDQWFVHHRNMEEEGTFKEWIDSLVNPSETLFVFTHYKLLMHELEGLILQRLKQESKAPYIQYDEAGQTDVYNMAFEADRLLVQSLRKGNENPYIRRNKAGQAEVCKVDYEVTFAAADDSVNAWAYINPFTNEFCGAIGFGENEKVYTINSFPNEDFWVYFDQGAFRDQGDYHPYSIEFYIGVNAILKPQYALDVNFDDLIDLYHESGKTTLEFMKDHGLMNNEAPAE